MKHKKIWTELIAILLSAVSMFTLIGSAWAGTVSFTPKTDSFNVYMTTSGGSVILNGVIQSLASGLSNSMASTATGKCIVSSKGYVWPLPDYYTLTSLFGTRSDPFTGAIAQHTGTDIYAPGGTPILAAHDGTVTYAQLGTGGYVTYGNCVDIQHTDGLKSRYAHMSSIAVSVGQTVKAGQVIGYVGSTGRSTGNHLHFEIMTSDGQRDDATKWYPDLTLYWSASGGTVLLQENGKRYYSYGS